MASSYTVLGTEKMTTGENAGTWGTKTNTNIEILEQAFGGYLAFTIDSTSETLAITDGDSTASTSQARHQVIKLSGTLSGNTTVTVPNDIVKTYVVSNATSGTYTVQFKTVSGTGFTFTTTNKGVKLLYADGTNIVDTGIGSHQIDNTITVGVDDTGYDVKFFGATASAYMLWDESADDLVLAGAAGIDLAGDIDVDGTANLDNTDIDGTLAVDGTTISLDATTSLNIDNSNTSNGITIGTATSGVPISIGHTTSEVTINDNLTVTGTLTLGSNAEVPRATPSADEGAIALVVILTLSVPPTLISIWSSVSAVMSVSASASRVNEPPSKSYAPTDPRPVSTRFGSVPSSAVA